MKQDAIRLDSGALSQGLRSDARVPRNSFYLVDCDNMKPLPFGLVESEAVTVAFSSADLTAAGITPAWPWPQLFHGSAVTVLLDETAAHIIDVSNPAAWSIGAALVPVETRSPYAANPITSGGSWQFVDLYDTWMALNGSCVVLKCFAHLLDTNIPDSYFCHDATTITTACYGRGRVFSAGFASADAPTLWETLHPNDVIWSSIGGQHNADDLWEFFPPLMTDKYKGLALDQRQVGTRRMTWQGLVECVKPLGAAIACYGQQGVSALTFQDDIHMGYQDISAIGIASRGAVGGDVRGHIFVDRTGFLWALTPDLQLAPLGYQEYLGALTLSDIVISLDTQRREFYISDGTTCYILTPSGMGSTSQQLTSLVIAPISASNSDLRCIQTTAPNTDVVIRIDEFDLGSKDNKTIESVALHFKDMTSVEVTAEWRNDSTSAFTAGPTVPVNDDGFCFPLTSGVNFRLLIEATQGTLSELHEIEIRFKRRGHRYQKGYVAPPPRQARRV